MKKIRKIMLMQPNCALLGKRTWEMIPYGLGLLKAVLGGRYEIDLFDPNFANLGEDAIRTRLKGFEPDVVGLTSFSTEYVQEIAYHTALIKSELPDTLVVLGGTFPTVLVSKALEDPNADYCVMGEGEYRFPALLDAVASGADVSLLDGVAFRINGNVVINPSRGFIQDLDSVPMPDFGDLDLLQYGRFAFKYAHTLIPKQYPFAFTISSRGCPFDCIFCAARTVSGTKVRMRSAANVLREIDDLVRGKGIREIIFLDDHFLHSKKRIVEIMSGIMERNYGITWKPANVAVFSLTRELMEMMKKSGCYQLTLSLESGCQEVLTNIIRKPVSLKRAMEVVAQAKEIGFELISNFVIGFPGETWDQIRETIAFAEKLDIDLVNFHIATPLPKTRLMEICIQEGFVKSENESLMGYTKGVIFTDEFSGVDLQILRAYEWDRINFKTPGKIARIAMIEGVTCEEVAQWRKRTRKHLGTTTDWNKEI
jgi:radical SAM superfamily enzyme YgiQ (UPF0313 family)